MHFCLRSAFKIIFQGLMKVALYNNLTLLDHLGVVSTREVLLMSLTVLFCFINTLMSRNAHRISKYRNNSTILANTVIAAEFCQIYVN